MCTTDPLSLHRVEQRFTAMGGPASIRLDSVNPALATKAISAARQEVDRLEAKYSRYRPDSVISSINRQAGTGKRVAIDDETVALLTFAQTMWQQSGHLFDPTSGVLRRAWDFSSGCLPEPGMLADILPLVGWDRIEWDSGSLHLAARGMELDLGGYVKEYAADCAVSKLLEYGLDSALVDLAGDIAATGPQADGKPWRIGIRNPAGGERPVAWTELAHGSVASSGNYQRCIRVGEKRYGHILNPRSGWPVQGLAAVSVTAPQCLVAGASSTIAMLMPVDQALEWLSRLGLPWLAVDFLGDIRGGPGIA